ncbi:hypothetical protein MJM43_28805, partial [Salmonella enterica subsp. enterica serovar Montevideo]|nr:hypothetical protein [Salmonella enterica subsp. enterica serovar Montevideo]
PRHKGLIHRQCFAYESIRAAHWRHLTDKLLPISTQRDSRKRAEDPNGEEGDDDDYVDEDDDGVRH